MQSEIDTESLGVFNLLGFNQPESLFIHCWVDAGLNGRFVDYENHWAVDELEIGVPHEPAEDGKETGYPKDDLVDDLVAG